MSLIEVNPRHLELVGKDRWEGLRTFLCHKVNAPSYMQSFRGQSYPGVAGSFAPVVRRVEAQYNPLTNGDAFATLTAMYETQREIGKAHIRVLTKSEAQQVLQDLDGKTIYGPDLHSDNGAPDHMTHWRVTQGMPGRLTPFCVVRAQTAYAPSASVLANAWALWDHVNANTMPNFGNAQPGTMRLVGLKLDWDLGDELAYLDYDFWWSGPTYTWNELVKSQRGSWVVLEEPRMQINPTTGVIEAADSGKKDPVRRFFPAHIVTIQADGTRTFQASTPEIRRLFPEGNFGAINSMAVW